MAGTEDAPRPSFWIEFALDEKFKEVVDKIRSETFPDMKWEKETHITLLYVGKYKTTKLVRSEIRKTLSKYLSRLSDEDRRNMFVVKDVVRGTWGDLVIFLLLEPANDEIKKVLEKMYRKVYKLCFEHDMEPQMTGATEVSRGSWHITLQFTYEKLDQLKSKFAPHIGQLVPVSQTRLVQKNPNKSDIIFH